MYEIDILDNGNWAYYYDSDNINEIDKEVFKLTNSRPNEHIRILTDTGVLCWLDGTLANYWYWKNRYVRDRGINYDYVKCYKRVLEKKETSNE